MRLLIVTQAVDLDDPVLGFFHRWIEELANRSESVQVVCLKKGRYSLPENVSVCSLGKESGPSRLKYVFRFYSCIWKRRAVYDAVFVHMNQEYVLLAGVLWRLLGKRIVLWRNHKKGSIATRIAALLAHVVCCTSRSAYVARYGNAAVMPIGIDTERFGFSERSGAGKNILFLGRLDQVKRPDLFIDALGSLAREGIEFHANIFGDPTDPADESIDALKRSALTLTDMGALAMHRGVRNEETPLIYQRHDIYVNLTPSGSFDKTIGEAAACGCILVCANDALRGVIPDELFVGALDSGTAASSIRAALSMPEAERRSLSKRLRQYVEREHSLSLLAERLFGIIRL